MNMKDLLRFMKSIKDFFYQFMSKAQNSCQYVKYSLFHNSSIEDIAETLKEEFKSIKIHVKAQPVQTIKVI